MRTAIDLTFQWTLQGERLLANHHFDGDPETDIAAGELIEMASDDLRQLLLGVVTKIDEAKPGWEARYRLKMWAVIDLQTGEQRSHPPRNREVIINGLPAPRGLTHRVRRHDEGRAEALAKQPTTNRGPRTDDTRKPQFGRAARGRRRAN